MYIRRLFLKNIRCFDELTLEFDQPGGSAVIVGDNGRGKSTILRSLAMGLCDESSAAALFRELPGEYVNHLASDDGVIEVDLVGTGGYWYRIKTLIKSLESFERVEQVLYRFRGNRRKQLTQDQFPWKKIFASGYGPGIRVNGDGNYDYYLTVDAVYSLFRYDAQLHNPELIIRRLIDRYDGKFYRRKDRGKVFEALQVLLNKLLRIHDDYSVELSSRGIMLSGEWGYADLNSAGDGYRATITWVIDLIAWWFLKAQQEDEYVDPVDVKGIVLIDEIEQHLHPRWQRSIISDVLSSFKGIQLIASTHSPLVASGCEGVPVHRIGRDDHQIENPYGWVAEDVYRMMGISSSRSEDFERGIEEFTRLDRRRLAGAATENDLKQLRKIRNLFLHLPQNDPTKIVSQIDNIRHVLRTERKQRLKKP